MPILLMVVSFIVYALLLGWQVAFGVMALIYVHEMGHLVVVRAKGLSPSPPFFVPMLGAFIVIRKPPRCVADEAWISLAGPLAGGAAAWMMAVSAATAQSRLLWALAQFGFMFNLFNLVPSLPLDGGRVAAALHPVLWVIGLIVLGLLAVALMNPLLWVIGALGALELYRRRHIVRRGQNMGYFSVSPRSRGAIGVSYGMLSAVLTVGLATARAHLG